MKVWIVDDEDFVCTIVGKFLGKVFPRAEITCFPTPIPALAELSDNPPDIVLMDGVMPEMFGPEAVAELRRRGWTGPVIEMHGFLPEGYQVPPGSSLLMKPFKMLELRDLVVALTGATSEGAR